MRKRRKTLHIVSLSDLQREEITPPSAFTPSVQEHYHLSLEDAYHLGATMEEIKQGVENIKRNIEEGRKENEQYWKEEEAHRKKRMAEHSASHEKCMAALDESHEKRMAELDEEHKQRMAALKESHGRHIEAPSKQQPPCNPLEETKRNTGEKTAAQKKQEATQQEQKPIPPLLSRHWVLAGAGTAGFFLCRWGKLAPALYYIVLGSSTVALCSASLVWILSSKEEEDALKPSSPKNSALTGVHPFSYRGAEEERG